MKPVVVEQSTPAEAAAPVACPDPFRILKIATCPSLSGRSTLTYHIGCKRHGDSTEIGTPFIRVYANSAAGLFSHDWVALDVIQQSFADAVGEHQITARLLDPLYRGKSANSPAFLFAVLKGAGLIRLVEDTKRLFERVDPGVFIAEVQALMVSGVDLKVEDEQDKAQGQGTVRPKPETPKPTAKKAGKKNRQGDTQ